MRLALLLASAWLFGCRPVPAAVAVPEVGPCAVVDGPNAVKRRAVLARLEAAGTSPRFFSGQNVGHASYEVDRALLTATKAATGQTPVVMGLDLGYGGLSVTDAQLDSFVTLAVEHSAAGGLVTVSLHPDNPITGGDVRDLTFNHVGNLLTPGAPGFDAWQRVLERTAQFLTTLKEQGVVVLFRPLHEMNGDWWWWRVQSPDDFKALWRGLHRDFEARGLDNLLWVYAPNFRQYDAQFPSDELAPYPGDACVDVVAPDAYFEVASVVNAQGSIDKLLTLGKPFGFAETGPSKQKADGSFDGLEVAKLKTLVPRAAYFVMWHSFWNGKLAIVDVKNGRELMEHDAVRTLERP